MRKLFICPSTLAPGYSSYSPIALKHLFNGKKVSPYLDFNFDDDDNRQEVILNMKSTTSSGLQEKFSGLLDGNHIRLTKHNEQGTYPLGLLISPIQTDTSKRALNNANRFTGLWNSNRSKWLMLYSKRAAGLYHPPL